MYKIKVVIDPNKPHEEGLFLCPEINLYTGKTEFIKEFGEITSLEEDVLLLGAAIYGSDIACKRGTQEDIVRSFELTIPVTNLSRFQQAADDIQYALMLLSHDAWNITFTQRLGLPEAVIEDKINNSGEVLLFSGGLDSFSAAAHLVKTSENIHLVSHITANPLIHSTQENLYKYLQEKYPGQFLRSFFRVSGIGKPTKGFEFPQDKDREDTQRTRSFMFLSLAALVARRYYFRDIVMIAENGQMAIHLPLSAGRISAFSTHTAHPEFVYYMGNILSTLLSYKIKINNPFLYLTKAEVVNLLLPTHRDKVVDTVSCWKGSRVSHFHHCGKCIPCMIRRIALEYNNNAIDEYASDIFNADISKIDPNDDGKRNIIELCEFILSFSNNQPLAIMQKEYPELVTGYFDPNKTVEMYQRFSKEALSVFKRYPNILSVME